MINKSTSENHRGTSLKITFYAIIIFIIFVIYVLLLNEDRIKTNENPILSYNYDVNIDGFDENKKTESIQKSNETVTTAFTINPKIELNKDIYHLNNNWMFNINLMQFSSYIIIKNDKNRNVEGMVYVNGDPSTKNLRCLLFSTELKKLIVLDVKFMYRAAIPYVRKIICEFDDDPNFDLNYAVVAIVFQSDFNLDSNNPSRYTTEIINYHIPQIIFVQEPRIKDVGICLQFVSRVYPGIYNWVQLHKDFKAAELVMYDGSHDKSLRNLLSKSFQKPFVDIYDYKIGQNEICQNKIILSYKDKFPNIYEKYKNTCFQTFQNTIARGYDGNHNHLSANDCYIKLNYKYEFVTLYDLDELIIPRFYDGSKIMESTASYVCTNTSHVCSLKPILLSMYDYFKRIIKSSFPHDISKLRSIEFLHAAYLVPTEMSINVLNQVKNFAEKFESNTFKENFPVKVMIGSHSMRITESDKNHVIKLNKFYNAFLCYYEKHLKKIPNFDENLLRYLYFMPGPYKRLPKSIHYTKNVYSLFTHSAIDSAEGSILFSK